MANPVYTGTMSWLQYYQAVKRGDLKTVKKAVDKDFRIALTMDKCALELAALHGHGNLVKYYLTRADKRADFELIVEALRDALRGGHVAVAKYLMNFIGPLVDLTDLQLRKRVSISVVLAAINGRSLNCLKLAWKYSVEKRAEYYGLEAFSSGSTAILQYIHEFGEHDRENLDWFKAHEIYAGAALPISFTMIALGDYRNAVKYEGYVSMKNEEDKSFDGQTYLITSPDNQSVETFTALDVAGYFGQLRILKILIAQLLKEPNFNKADFFSQLHSVMKFALRKNHLNVVKYLVESRLMMPRPPYKYEGFRINDAFEYLRWVTVRSRANDGVVNWNSRSFPIMSSVRDREGPELTYEYDQNGNCKTVLKTVLAEDRSASRLTKAGDFYDYLKNSRLRPYSLSGGNAQEFLHALAEQNVDVALSCVKRFPAREDMSCLQDAFSIAYHDYLTKAMSSPCCKFDLIPSPVVVELVMTLRLLRGRCACQRPEAVNVLDSFLKVEPTHVHGPSSNTVLSRRKNFEEMFKQGPELSLEVYKKRAEAVLEVLFTNGVPKPKSRTEIDDAIARKYNRYSLMRRRECGREYSSTNFVPIKHRTGRVSRSRRVSRFRYQ